MWLQNELIATFLPLAAVAIVAAFYIVVPLAIRRSLYSASTCSYRACELENLPPEAAPFFFEKVPALAAAGFRTLGCAMRTDVERKQETSASLWINAENLDKAEICTVVSEVSGRSAIWTVSFSFSTKFADGTDTITSHHSYPNVWPAALGQKRIRLRHLDNPAELYRLHRARIAYHRGGQQPIFDQAKDAVALLELDHAQTYRRLVGIGYFSFDAAADEYIPTLSGTFRMVYRLLPPWKQIQRWLMDRSAQREMRIVGFKPLRPPTQ